MFHKTRMYCHYFHLICDTILYYTDLIKFILLFTFLSRSADTSGMLDTSLKREISGEFEEDQDLPIEVNLPCNEDLQMLLNRIELQLPKDDHVKYDSRARKLDWDQIKFKDYSAEDCKKYWEHIQVAQDT